MNAGAVIIGSLPGAGLGMDVMDAMHAMDGSLASATTVSFVAALVRDSHPILVH